MLTNQREINELANSPGKVERNVEAPNFRGQVIWARACRYCALLLTDDLLRLDLQQHQHSHLYKIKGRIHSAALFVLIWALMCCLTSDNKHAMS